VELISVPTGRYLGAPDDPIGPTTVLCAKAKRQQQFFCAKAKRQQQQHDVGHEGAIKRCEAFVPLPTRSRVSSVALIPKSAQSSLFLKCTVELFLA